MMSVRAKRALMEWMPICMRTIKGEVRSRKNLPKSKVSDLFYLCDLCGTNGLVVTGRVSYRKRSIS